MMSLEARLQHRLCVLQDEIAASKADLVFYRKCMHALTTGVLSKDHKKIYIVGPASSGKSITMATAVIQMRALGWLVCLLRTI